MYSDKAGAVGTGLFGKTRQAVLALLYRRAGDSLYTKQIMDTVNSGRGAVQRELKNLTESGIIVREVRGRQVYYRANRESPIFNELSNIMKGATAPAPEVREKAAQYAPGRTAKPLSRIAVPKRELATFCRRNYIRRLSFFGSVLRQDFRPDSDVDVLVEFEPDHFPGFFKLADMQEELSTLLGGRKVDLRTPGDLSRYFRQRVLDEAQVMYAAA